MVPLLSRGAKPDGEPGRYLKRGAPSWWRANVTDERPPSLEELETRLRQARQQAGLDKTPEQIRAEDLDNQSMGSGVRIGVELVAALLVGIGGGLLFDNWLETRPWGLIIGFLLGAGAGIVNVYRLISGVGYAVGYDHPANPAKGNGQAQAGSAGEPGEQGRGRRG